MMMHTLTVGPQRLLLLSQGSSWTPCAEANKITRREVCRRQTRQRRTFAARCSGMGESQATTRRAVLGLGASSAGVALWGGRSCAAENSAILNSLKQRGANNTLEKQELEGRNRLLGAKQQLAQVQRLALAGSYKDARLQLRKGSMARVRADVRAAEQELGGLRKETGDELVMAIEELDQGLRREAPPAELKGLLAAVANADDRVQAELILPVEPK